MPPKILTRTIEKITYFQEISEINPKTWKYGNIFNFGDYRDTQSVIVGPDLIPIMNPDLSGSGYLSIPYEITQHITNAVELYSQYVEGGSIDVRPDDKYIIEKYGVAMPSTWKITLFFADNPQVDKIVINNGKVEKDFEPADSLLDISREMRSKTKK